MTGVERLNRRDLVSQLEELLSKGATRQEAMSFIEEHTACKRTAREQLYYQALRNLSPANLEDDERRYLIRKNLDRLEGIINETITGNTREKKVALAAIDSLNKMLGVGGSNVTIAQNREGEQVIEIKFGE